METKKIWLLNPPFPEKFIRVGRCEQKADFFQVGLPPLILAYMASILRKKYIVRIIDSVGEDYSKKDIIRLYLREKPDLVFLETTTPTIEYDLKLINSLSKLHKSKFAIYGVHISYLKSIKKLKDCDIKIIHEEPEKYAFKLIGKKNNLKDLDSLPFPAWDLINLKNYKLPLKNKSFTLIQPSRGCPYKCIFCTNPFYYGSKVRLRSVDSVIQEIKYIKKFNINNIFFYSDLFSVNKEWVKELCKRIITEKLNVEWMANSRVDSIDKETLTLMKKAGQWLISFGIESGDQEILNLAKKQTKIKQVYEAVNLAHSLGILTLGHFILGLPGETEGTLKGTINFSKKLRLDFAMFYIATPFPGSELYEVYKKKLNNDWNKFEYSKQIINSKLNLHKWQKRAYNEFYIRNFSLKKQLRILKIIRMRNIINMGLSGINFIKIFFKNKSS